MSHPLVRVPYPIELPPDVAEHLMSYLLGRPAGEVLPFIDFFRQAIQDRHMEALAEAEKGAAKPYKDSSPA